MNTIDTNKPIDVSGIGNAMVDILSHEKDRLITDLGLKKGAMTLVDLKQANDIFEKMGTTMMQSGGSGANTIAGIASFGGACAYMGLVADDDFGNVFFHDMRALGIQLPAKTVAKQDDGVTARCHILVTPDGERTMCTHLGVSTEFSEENLDPEIIAQSKVLYLEGYLFDKPSAKEAFEAGAKIAKDNGTLVALTLSDLFCVDRHRDAFQDLVANHVDLLFSNEEEILALYQVNDLSTAFDKLKMDCPYAAVTMGENGAAVLHQQRTYRVDAITVDKVVDTTGAGDLFASGFLYGFTHGLGPRECGILGVKASGEVITHLGGRPEIELKTLLAA